MNIFLPKGFLQLGGAILLLAGLLGVSVFHLSNMTNAQLIAFGIVSIICAFILPKKWQDHFVVILGVVAILNGLYFFVQPRSQVYALVFFLIIGAWALYSVFGNAKRR